MNNEMKLIYNPDGEDFTVTYDINENGIPEKFTIPAGEAKRFITPIADHIMKHLANRLVMKRGIKTNYQDEYERVLKEIEQTT